MNARPAERQVSRYRPAAMVVLALLLGGLATVAGPAAPAHAQGSVVVANEFGNAEADLQYSTEITVTGSGFQSVQGGFGGIYVLFGWVSDPEGGSWRPSNGGHTGSEYQYVPDTEDKDNQGFQRFISFPGSETEYAANGGLVDSGGNWSLTMVVPGPTFSAYDRDNNVVDVDCRTVTCGVITVGAHGVVNAANESFTPLTFGTIFSAEQDAAAGEGDPTGQAAGENTAEEQQKPAEGPADTAEDAAGDAVPESAEPVAESTAGTTATATKAEANAAGSAGEDADGQKAETAPSSTLPTSTQTAGTESVDAEITVDRATAVVGRVLSFTARGFAGGEQIVVVLDDGVAAVGPLTAGADGAIAGVLPMPAAIGVGTHVVRATGAASGTTVESAFPVKADETAVAAAAATAPPAPPATGGPTTAAWIFLGAAGAILAVVLALFVVKAVGRRRRRKVAAAGEAATAEPAAKTKPAPGTGAAPAAGALA